MIPSFTFHLFTIAVCLGSLLPLCAYADIKMEAENAAYENCTLIRSSKYSGGKALELTEDNAKITFIYSYEDGGKKTVYVGYDGVYGNKIYYKK